MRLYLKVGTIAAGVCLVAACGSLGLDQRLDDQVGAGGSGGSEATGGTGGFTPVGTGGLGSSGGSGSGGIGGAGGQNFGGQGGASMCAAGSCAVDCEVSSWSDWSTCSQDCNEGLQFRSREVLVKPSPDGTACPPLQEQRTCKIRVCEPVDCKLSDWGAFTDCSVACGEGIKSRERTILAPAQDGGSCAPLVEVVSCNLEPCVLPAETP